jgi:hypothetical protein
MWRPDAGGSAARQLFDLNPFQGDLPRTPCPGSIFDGGHADLFVATTDVPDGHAREFEPRGKLCHNGGGVSHRKQNSRSSGDPLLRVAVANEVQQVDDIIVSQIDISRWAPSHARCVPRRTTM